MTNKLQGNERWKSKMLLTEHQEQYQSRHNKPESGRATSDEMKLIRDSVMLPHMLTMCDKSLREAKQSTTLFKRFFVQLIQLTIDSISKDLFALRRELKNRNIKIVDDEVVDGIIYHRYLCRGYEEKFGIVREALRSEISVRMAQYASSILHPEPPRSSKERV